MNGICGWAGYRPESQSPQALLASMLGLEQPVPGEATAHHLDENHGVAAHTAVGMADSTNKDTLFVAISGRPRWRDTALTRQAGEQGAATVVASLYRSCGADFLQQLHGTFAVAVIDKARGRTVLAIDRLGIGNLCYATRDDAIVFGTTATSVARHPLTASDYDPQAIYDYLYFHMVPSPRSICRGQRKLLPAQCITFESGRIHESFYWEIPYESHNHASYEDLKSELHSLLADAVSDPQDTPSAGCFLSGGTDSSTVTGMLTKVTRQPAGTYSIGFDAEGFDETEFARAAADHFGTRHHEYYVTPADVTQAIPLVAAAYDEPFGNASAIPTYYCAKMAHDDGCKVLLAGDGGDEIFGGNARYATQKLFELYGSIPSLLRRGLIDPLAFSLPGAQHIAPLRKLQSYIRQARIPLPDRLENYNFLHRTSLEEIFPRDFLDVIDPSEPLGIINEVYTRTRGNSSLHRMLHLDMKNTLADNDLRKVTRMCELAGVEVRYPLLDEQLVEFSAGVPPAMKIRGLKLRYFFKRALSDFLPPATLSKSKHGFGLPFGLWLQNYAPLQELAYSSLRSLESRGYIRPEYIENLLRQHQSEHASYYGVMIWVLMMLEQWFQTHESGTGQEEG